MLKILKARFEENKNRHPDVTWETVEALLAQDDNKLSKIKWMEQSGGEPVGYGGELVFIKGISEVAPKPLL